MKISTKGRYALRLMLDLAQNNTGEPIRIKDIAARQGISDKYLEQIVQMLVKSSLLVSFRGANGGYKLTKKPEEITVAEILRATEGSLSVVNCMDKNACGNNCNCRVRKCWDRLNGLIDEYLQSISLAELLVN